MKSKVNKAKRAIELTSIGNYLNEIKESAVASNCNVWEFDSKIVIAGKSILTYRQNLADFVAHWNDNNSVHIIDYK